MIISSFIDRSGQFVSWLFQREWAEWEIITIAVTVVFVLLWIISRQRKRAIRRVYENRFMESSPVIGMNLGAHKRSHHLIRDLKKARLAAIQKKHPKQQKPTKKTEASAKLHEQIKQLQYEIIKRKQSEVHLEERIAHLTAANEKIQLKLAETKQAEKQTDEKPIEEKSTEKENKYENTHRIVDGVKQKLCRKCREWKPETEFHKNASCKDGLAVSCKTCKAEAAREYRKRRKTAKG